MEGQSTPPQLLRRLIAALHRWLGAWSQQMPARGLGEMPLLSLVDLPLLLALSPRIYLATAGYLAAYRRNLTDRRWSGLQGVYSRDYLWGYAYLLFFWARHCGVLADVLRQPERSVPAELFLRYVCEVDAFIDRADTRELWPGAPERLKALPQARAILHEFLQRLCQPGIEPESRRAVVQLVADFRRASYRAVLPDASPPPEGMLPILRHKEQTVGNLMRTWSLILALQYQTPEPVAQQAGEVIFQAGMALQMIDDLSDAVVDYREGVVNLFLGVVQERPDDWAKLRDHLAACADPYLSWAWVRENIPVSYAAALALREQSLIRLAAAGPAPASALHAQLHHEIAQIVRRLGLVNS
jgi:hypothetical protein